MLGQTNVSATLYVTAGITGVVEYVRSFTGCPAKVVIAIRVTVIAVYVRNGACKFTSVYVTYGIALVTEYVVRNNADKSAAHYVTLSIAGVVIYVLGYGSGHKVLEDVM